MPHPTATSVIIRSVIRAVCFDLGGVVVLISYHWAEMLMRCGLPVPDHIAPDDDLHAMPQFDAYQAGNLTDEQYIKRLGAYLGIADSEAMRVHCSMLVEPFPGIREIVEQLNGAGMVTGCLSNTNAPHWDVLLTYPAIAAMQVRVASFQIDANKPDERAFRAFESASGCKGEDIVLFDDSFANVEAARALGWRAHLVDPRADPAAQILAEL